MRYAIIGAGALGTLIASRLHHHGSDVVLIEEDASRRTRVNQGTSITGYRTGPIVTPRITSWEDTDAEVDALLLCVKPDDVNTALAAAQQAFSSFPVLISFVGGFRHVEVCQAWPGETVFAVANIEARIDEAGNIESAFHNFIWLGNLKSTQTEVMKRVQHDLAWVAPTLTGKVIHGMLWGKAIYTLEAGLPPLAGMAPQQYFADQGRRENAAAIVREGIAVAQGNGITPIAFDFFDPNLYLAATPGERSTLDSWMKHAWQRHEQFRFGLEYPFPDTCGLGWSLSPANKAEELSGILEDFQAAGEVAKVPTPAFHALAKLITEAKQGGEVTIADINAAVGKAAGVAT